MNYASIAIAVEKAIAKLEMEFLCEDAKDWHEKYGPAAGSLLAGQACVLAGRFKHGVDLAQQKYGCYS